MGGVREKGSTGALALLMTFGLMVGLALVVSAPKPPKPKLEMKFSPIVAINPTVFTFTARLTGPEEERLYCPEVEWEWTDGSRSVEEADCPPWEQHTEGDYQRVFIKRKLLGFCYHSITIRLKKHGKTIMAAEVNPTVSNAECR